MTFIQDYTLSTNLDKQSITCVTCTKFVGVYIEEQLSWRQYITHISGKLTKNICTTESSIFHPNIYETKQTSKQWGYVGIVPLQDNYSDVFNR